MIEVKKEGVLLQKTSLGFENFGVLNPGVIKEGDHIHLFYRAVSKGNYSSIGYCKLKSPLIVEERLDTPLLFPQFEYESKGIEDPRIVKIEDLFYLTYTAYDGINALGALATSKDLLHFDKLGIIVPQITYEEFSHLAESKGIINEKYLRYNKYIQEKQDKKFLIWDKNVIFFPRKINGKLYFLHLEEYIVLSAKYKHEVSYIGGGCPPIETSEGWLLIYHGVHDTIKGYVYSACAALVDLDNPQKEIARLSYPLFRPEYDWELKGEVNNVCFPTGSLVVEDTLYVYYGAADEQIACASISISALLKELMFNIKKDDK